MKVYKNQERNGECMRGQLGAVVILLDGDDLLWLMIDVIYKYW